MENNRFITPEIAALQEYLPDSGEYRIRLDANESPYLPSSEMAAAMENAVRGAAVNRYPDPAASGLITAFAGYYGVGDENCAAGNGSDELISIIISAFAPRGTRMLVVDPDFSMYGFYGGITGADIVRYQKSDGFAMDFGEVANVSREKKVNLVIFSNPCNPTGRVYGREVIEKFCSEVPALIVVDEAYMEFSEGDFSVMESAVKQDNLIVLKTLSKAFGIAGLRVGFTVSCPALASVIRKVKSPYNINAISQALGKAVLSFPDEIRGNIDKIKRETALMRCEIGEMSAKLYPGDGSGRYSFKLYETQTNFVLMEFAGGAAAEIYSKLKERGIKIRLIGKNFLRVSAGTIDETREFLDTFKEILSCGQPN